jgi:hypothetical protein
VPDTCASSKPAMQRAAEIPQDGHGILLFFENPPVVFSACRVRATR